MQIAQHITVQTEAEAGTLQISCRRIMRLAVASEAGAKMLQNEPLVATQNNNSKSEIWEASATRPGGKTVELFQKAGKQTLHATHRTSQAGFKTTSCEAYEGDSSQAASK